MPLKRRMVKKNVVHLYGVLFTHLKSEIMKLAGKWIEVEKKNPPQLSYFRPRKTNMISICLYVYYVSKSIVTKKQFIETQRLDIIDQETMGYS